MLASLLLDHAVLLMVWVKPQILFLGQKSLPSMTAQLQLPSLALEIFHHEMQLDLIQWTWGLKFFALVDGSPCCLRLCFAVVKSILAISENERFEKCLVAMSKVAKCKKTAAA